MATGRFRTRAPKWKLRNFKGPATVEFHLAFPLHEDNQNRVQEKISSQVERRTSGTKAITTCRQMRHASWTVDKGDLYRARCKRQMVFRDNLQ